MIVCVDFDGTCVTHEYPEIGKNIGAKGVLRDLVDKGHQLILWTMRSGDKLEDAVEWFKFNSIPLYGIQRNPTQDTWTTSPKAYGQLYIDDAALGCPLVHIEGARPFVDWEEVREILVKTGVL